MTTQTAGKPRVAPPDDPHPPPRGRYLDVIGLSAAELLRRREAAGGCTDLAEELKRVEGRTSEPSLTDSGGGGAAACVCFVRV